MDSVSTYMVYCLGDEKKLYHHIIQALLEKRIRLKTE